VPSAPQPAVPEDPGSKSAGPTNPALHKETSVPKPTVRPHLVALLLDADLPDLKDPATWTRQDGRPFTEEERTLMVSATSEERRAFADQVLREEEFWQDRIEASNRLIQLIAPFFAQLSADSGVADLVDLMGEDALAALDQIAHVLSSDGIAILPITILPKRE